MKKKKRRIVYIHEGGGINIYRRYGKLLLPIWKPRGKKNVKMELGKREKKTPFVYEDGYISAYRRYGRFWLKLFGRGKKKW